MFGKIKALPNDEYGNEKPITDWRVYANAFANIAKGIREVVEELSDSSFYIKKSLRQIVTGVMSVTNTLTNAFANLAIATFFSLFRRSRSRRNKVSMIRVALVLVIIVGSIFLISKLPHPSRISALAPSAPSSVTVGNVYNVHCSGYDAINVRSKPSQNASRVSRINCSDTVTVTGNLTQGWYPVKTSTGQTGYITKVAINP
jgi:4-amino-4-deoxy-L-arabinose transferase-like glycosyltransferase